MIINKDKLRNVLVTRTAIKTLTDETIVDKIISFQGRDASQQAKQNHEVEFSGFGKFMISQKKLRNRITNLETSIAILKQRPQRDEEKINSIKEEVEFLKTKLK